MDLSVLKNKTHSIAIVRDTEFEVFASVCNVYVK